MREFGFMMAQVPPLKDGKDANRKMLLTVIRN